MYEYSFISDFLIFLIFPFCNTVVTPVDNIQIIRTTTFASLHILIYSTKINHYIVQIKSIRDRHKLGYYDVIDDIIQKVLTKFAMYTQLVRELKCPRKQC